jgi:hypothetical protein
MPNSVNEQLADQTTYSNLKSSNDMAITAMNLSTENAVANQQVVQAMINANLQNGLTLAQHAMAGAIQQLTAVQTIAVKRLFDTTIEQAMATTEQINADMAKNLAAYSATLSAGQQEAKIAQSTPPESAVAAMLANLAASISAIETMLKAQAVRG